MTLTEFEAQEAALADVLTCAIKEAVESLDFDLRCIDWFVSSPEVADFYIKQKNQQRLAA